MHKKMITYYNNELSYLREMGHEFANQYPKVASRLGLDTADAPDPYVERLLEGISFLTARTQLKIDSEYPHFVRNILEVIYPQFLTPIPSCAIVNVIPDSENASVAYSLKRGQTLNSLPINLPSQVFSCTFSTTQDTNLTPIKIDRVSYNSQVNKIPNTVKNHKSSVDKSVLTLNLSVRASGRCSDLMPKNMSIFLGQDLSVSSQLLHLMLCHCHKIVCHDVNNSWAYPIIEKPTQAGLTEDEAMVFNLDRSISGLRLLQEYMQLPEKFAFIKQAGIDHALWQAEEDGQLAKNSKQADKLVKKDNINKRMVSYDERQFCVSFVFDEFIPDLQQLLKSNSLSINATPVVNLYKKKGIRFPVNMRAKDHHVIIDRTQPLNYEVHNIEKVKGYDVNNNLVRVFKPVYHTNDMSLAPIQQQEKSYFSVRRVDRVPPKQNKSYRTRTSYLGSEAFLSLVTENNSVFESGIAQLGIDAWVTNRDLPLILPRSEESDFEVDNSLPIKSIHILTSITRPKEAIHEDDSVWALLNQVNLSYASLVGKSGKEVAMQIKQLLLSMPNSNATLIKSQIESIKSIDIVAKNKVTRSRGAGSLVRGLGIIILIDESLMGGVHPYIFCSILRQFLTRSVAVNSFVEVAVKTIQQGNIIEWPAEIGNKVSL